MTSSPRVENIRRRKNGSTEVSESSVEPGNRPVHRPVSLSIRVFFTAFNLSDEASLQPSQGLRAVRGSAQPATFMASPRTVDERAIMTGDDAMLRFATSANTMGCAPSRGGGVSRERRSEQGRHADLTCAQPEQVVGTGTHDVLGRQAAARSSPSMTARNLQGVSMQESGDIPFECGGSFVRTQHCRGSMTAWRARSKSFCILRCRSDNGESAY
jgi:hypothetical protein